MSWRTEVVNVSAWSIESKVWSKRDLYDLFKEHCKKAPNFTDQFFLPGYLYTPIKFLKEIWTGDKTVSLKNDSFRFWKLKMYFHSTSQSMKSWRLEIFTIEFLIDSLRWRITFLTMMINTSHNEIFSGEFYQLFIQSSLRKWLKKLKSDELLMKKIRLMKW